MTVKTCWRVRLKACIEAIKQRAKYNDEHELNRAQRWFYTAKAIICLLAGRQKSLYVCLDNKIDSVACWGFWTDFDGCSNWTELAVGRGVFVNWHYDIYGNGS